METYRLSDYDIAAAVTDYMRREHPEYDDLNVKVLFDEDTDITVELWKKGECNV
jgi:hypothetical protein